MTEPTSVPPPTPEPDPATVRPADPLPAPSRPPVATPERIRALLDELGIAYRHVVHGPTRTSEESAAARGEPLEIGAKALLLKIDDAYRLFVLSAARKADSAAIKKHFRARSLRFATPDELLAQTGLVPGSVPPFGEPILPFELYVDSRVAGLDRVAFNAASLTESLVLSCADYLRAAQPTGVFTFGSEG